MRLVKFGRTGLFVSELALGTMTFGGDGIWKGIGGLCQKDAEVLIGLAVDAGINLIDTADVYAAGESEIIVGAAIRNLQLPRDSFVVATKAMADTGRGPNAQGTSRYHLMNAVKASLVRLQLDHVDIYQLHGFDPATSIEESLRALDRLVQDGLVRYVGVSNWAAWQIAKALGIAARLGLSPLDSLQAHYTIAARDLEREIVPMLQSEGLALMVWSPLAGGILSGKYPRDGMAESGSRRNGFDFPPINRDRVFACIDVMASMAESRGASTAQIALSWLLHQPVVTSVIVGARRPEQLQECVGAAGIQLTPSELEVLGAIAPPPAEYPGWILDMVGWGRHNLLRDSASRMK